MRQSVLFLPAAIKSHIIPAFFLAELLRDNFEIWFAVSNEVLEELVLSQGYLACRTSPYRVAVGMENRFVVEQSRVRSRFHVLRAIWNDDLTSYREKELIDIIDRIQPTCIFIDIFNSTDLLVMFPLHERIRFVFLNPMLSTYRINGFPTVSEGRWPKSFETKQVSQSVTFRQALKRPIDTLIDLSIRQQLKRLINRRGFFLKYPLATDRTTALLFDNIPEVLLAPLELEVSPEVRKEHQHYVGLCVSEYRKDIQLDPSFQNRFDKIIAKRNAGAKLIYCSFGTFYEGSYRALVNFINRLLDAIELLENIDCVFSVNTLVIETLNDQRIIPPNIHLFSGVPQLQVLMYSDLFITHGGLGSIKEGIHFSVPMLVYPLDLHYDQNGNGFKVELHGLGMSGVFQNERSVDMQRKIRELLSKVIYKENLTKFKLMCTEKYSYDNVLSSLNRLIASI
jgi:hypothetical protein